MFYGTIRSDLERCGYACVANANPTLVVCTENLNTGVAVMKSA